MASISVRKLETNVVFTSSILKYNTDICNRALSVTGGPETETISSLHSPTAFSVTFREGLSQVRQHCPNSWGVNRCLCFLLGRPG